MLDHPTPMTPGLRPWRDRLLAAIGPSMNGLGRALGGGTMPADLTFELVKDGPRAVSVSVGAGPRQAHLKVYDGPDASDRYSRERGILLALRGKGLVAPLILFSDQMNLLVTETMGPPLSVTHLSDWGPQNFGRALGTWLARYDMCAPSREGGGDWYTHVRQHCPELRVDRLADAAEVLKRVPVCGLVVAQNDAALGNFVIDDLDGLWRVDFEAAGLRPRGWDYVFMRHAVRQRHPDQADQILGAMSMAFDRAHRGAVVVGELDAVSEALFSLTALRDHAA